MSPDDTLTVDAYNSGWSEMMNRIRAGGSWSGHERNCCFLNTGQRRFANVSGVSGLDFPDDGRCVAPVDWDHDGDLDLWLSARTGPTLRFLRNNSRDGAHFVSFLLEGTTCNRNAIGARIEVTAGQETLIRTVHAGDGYLSQASRWVHFGLGNRETLERVAVRWPGGATEEFSGVLVDGHFVLRQGDRVARSWQPPERTVELTPSRLDTIASERATRIVLRDRVPMVELRYEELSGGRTVSVPRPRRPAPHRPESPASQQAALAAQEPAASAARTRTASTAAQSGESVLSRPAESAAAPGGAVLISLWATWCQPCLVELKEFSAKADDLRAAGIDIVALNVEAAGEDGRAVVPGARELLTQQIAFPFRSGLATPQLLEKLDALQEVLISLRPAPGQLPSSFLVDRFGRLRVIYPGQVSVEQLVRDARLIEEPGDFWLPLPGRWASEPDESLQVLVELSREFRTRGFTDEALRFARLAADVASRDRIPQGDRLELAALFFDTGLRQLQQQEPDEAVRNLQEAVRLRPDWAEAYANLGSACRMLGRQKAAEQHLLRAVRFNPDLVPPRFGLGLICLNSGRNRKAADHFRSAIALQPDFAEGYHRLGIALLRLGVRQDGLAMIQQALRLDPDNPAARHSLNLALQGQRP